MLRRHKKIEIDRVQAEVCVNVAIELDEGTRVHRRAVDELTDGGLSAATREQLLLQARQASLVCRTAFDLVDRLAELPDGIQPFGAIRSLQRVAFGMIGLAQDPPDMVAALTTEELDGAVLEEDGREWLAWMLERAGS